MTSRADVIRQHIEIVQGSGGPKPRISGSRIRVANVAIWHEKLGMSLDEILQQYPTINAADIYAALASTGITRPRSKGAVRTTADRRSSSRAITPVRWLRSSKLLGRG